MLLLLLIAAAAAKIECELTDKEVHQIGAVYYITDYTMHRSSSGVSRRELQDFCLHSRANRTLQWAECYECNPLAVADELDRTMFVLWMILLGIIVAVALGLLYKPYWFDKCDNPVCSDKQHHLSPDTDSNQKKLVAPHEQTMVKK